MLFIVVILIILLLVLSVFLYKLENKTLGFDVLNNYELLHDLEKYGIVDIKLYRRRQNSYYKQNSIYKLIELGNDNDVIQTSFQYNAVQDIEIWIIGIKRNGSKVIINKYEYSIDSKTKSLKLKAFLMNKWKNA